ncbi:Chitin synthase activator (Chs3) [Tolypocladium capitatum]|uniref:Chitin synthase activator (Chs3) n=1 Tax=Tolypocladium capitatum TaxID=45235 RepID=A0A2K3QFD2_9HYPO|nr:Chitin synthase activator (Chs3) [Tolypocladium capitatum]
MAYQGEYAGGGGHQRQFAGPPAPRPAPRGYGDRPPPTRHYGAQQPYDGYHDGYGHDGQDGGYAQDQGQQYPAYHQAQGQPPPQDYFGPGPGRGGRPMPPSGRGGPIPRPATADGHRAGPYPPRGRGMGRGRGRGAGGPGRGGGPAGPYAANSDQAGRWPPVSNGPPGRGEPAYGMDQDLSGQMSGMSLDGQRSRGYQEARTSSEGYSEQGVYPRRPVDGGRGPPPRDFPPQQAPEGHGGYDDYESGPNGAPRDNLGLPGRSMTVPPNSARHNMPPLQRMETMPYIGPAGRGVPQRPSTTTGSRPPPQGTYPPNPQGPPQDASGGGYNDGHGYEVEPAPSVDDVFDAYYDNPRMDGIQEEPHRSVFPDFDSTAPQRGQGTMRPGPEQPHPGPHQTPRLHHARSEANVGEPQAAVFEMAADIPSVPPMPNQPGFAGGYGTPGGYEPMPPPPRGPSAPPGPGNGPRAGGFPGNDGLSRSVTGLSLRSSNTDPLPSHPVPVRPGLMANSLVSLNDRPPPVRNYSGVSQAAPMEPQPAQQQPPPKGQQQYVLARAGHQVPEVAHFEEPVTPQELERLRMVIKGNANDQESALRLAKKLIEAADMLAPKLPDPKQRARARERYLVDAHKILKKLSNAQNQDATFIMADGLGKGLFGHEPDNKEAFTLYQSAAKFGHAAAAYRTAVCCEIGHEEGGGTRKDPLKAMQWYKRAATLGDPPAMYKVGMILLKGLLGQPRNPREAVGWLKRAAERADTENPHALHELGLLYESAQPNDVIIRDERYALNLFQQAAELGYKFSQFRLGCVFEYGLSGCPIDPRQSIYWYSKAATQEEHQSELALSGWYLTGSEGVLGQSDTEAYLWARKAAVAGLSKAEYAMGYFTEVGIGVPANLEDAKRWYWRAAAQDFPKARERLEDLKGAGKNGYPRQRERISRSRIEKQQEGECTVM